MAYINGKEILFPIIKAADGSVLYSETQDLTDEQKQTARENINAVDASLVVSRVTHNDHIPNGAALLDFFVSSKDFTPEQQQAARKNIGAVSQSEIDEAVTAVKNEIAGEAWETIADITLEEATAIIKIDQDTNGQAFSLKRAKIIVDTDNTTSFYTATGTIMMGLMSADNGISARSMYLNDFIPNTAGKYSRAFFEIELVGGMAFVSGCCKNNLSALNNGEFASPFAKYSNLPFAAKNGIINDIRFTTNHSNGFAIGTHIKVLGVRA